MTAVMRLREGDDLHVHARMVVAPVAGVFRAAAPGTFTTEGEILVEGQVIGVIEGSGREVEVVSAFTGFFMGSLAETGERVRPGQPVAWLHDVDLGRRR
jgi:biotin carboxyl carrier protein